MPPQQHLNNELVNELTSFFTFSRVQQLIPTSPALKISSQLEQRIKATLALVFQIRDRFRELENFTDNFVDSILHVRITRRMELAHRITFRMAKLVASGQTSLDTNDVATATNILTEAANMYCVLASLLAEDAQHESFIKAFKIVPLQIAGPTTIENLSVEIGALKNDALTAARTQNQAVWNSIAAARSAGRQIPNVICCNHDIVQPFHPRSREWRCLNANCPSRTSLYNPSHFEEIAYHQLVCPFGHHGTVQFHPIDIVGGFTFVTI